MFNYGRFQGNLSNKSLYNHYHSLPVGYVIYFVEYNIYEKDQDGTGDQLAPWWLAM